MSASRIKQVINAKRDVYEGNLSEVALDGNLYKTGLPPEAGILYLFAQIEMSEKAGNI